MNNIIFLLIVVFNIFAIVPVINISKLIDKDIQEIKQCKHYAKLISTTDHNTLFLCQDSELICHNTVNLFLHSHYLIHLKLSGIKVESIDFNDQIFLSGEIEFSCQNDSAKFVSFIDNVRVSEGCKLIIKYGGFDITIIGGSDTFILGC